MSSNDTTPDDDAGGLPLHVDAHGQASLLLVESLIHGLIERSMLTSMDAVEIVQGAFDIQGQLAEAADGASARMWQAQALLERILVSLKLDLRDDPTITR